MGQGIDPSKSVKHTCIFELERKGKVFTGEVVCTACGVYLSSRQDRPLGTRQGRGRRATLIS
jgi:hypothetical protein